MTLLARLRGLLPSSMRRPGVLGIVLTAEGHVVLVRHTYVPGWYPPGGGIRRGETAEAAVMREVREEIGLKAWTSIEALGPSCDAPSTFVVRDAVYRFHRSLEIEAVGEFALDDLPADASPRLRRLLGNLRSS